MKTCKVCGTPTSMTLNGDPYCGLCYSFNGGDCSTETKAQRRAKEDIIAHLISWLEAAEEKGQSPAPVHFGSLVSEDMTLRDLVEIARGRRAQAKQ